MHWSNIDPGLISIGDGLSPHLEASCLADDEGLVSDLLQVDLLGATHDGCGHREQGSDLPMEDYKIVTL